MARERWGARWYLFVAALLVAFVAVRFPLYVEPGIRLGWNSDSALYGLMARAMVDTRQPIFLFWGGDYLGTLTSLWTVAIGIAIGDVGPLALRLGTACEFLIAILLFWDALGRVYGRAAASAGALWLAAGPFFFFKLSYAPVSAEQMFFAGAVVFWYVVRRPFDRPVQWLILGVMCGAGWWAHRGMFFVALPAGLVALVFDRWTSSPRRIATAAAAFAIGLPIGLLPQFIGRSEINQRLYTPLTSQWWAGHVFEQLKTTLTTDLWSFLGTDRLPLLPWAGGMLILALVAHGLRGVSMTRGHALALGVVITNFGFWFISVQAYGGAVRYLILALPIVYTLAARGLVRLAEPMSSTRRALAVGVALTVAVALYVPRFRDARAVADGLREQHEKWPGGFDPRPLLAQLERERYAVCYADFWLAYKLEWLSTTGVQFIPYRSVNSTQARSLRLASSPGRKCFISLDGKLRALSAQEEAVFRADTIAHVSGRRRRAV